MGPLHIAKFFLGDVESLRGLKLVALLLLKISLGEAKQANVLLGGNPLALGRRVLHAVLGNTRPLFGCLREVIGSALQV